MNLLDSECRSGCESGWTLYLEHSFLSPGASRRNSGYVNGNNGYYDEPIDKRVKEEAEEEVEEEEEDQSMVSDASSGPPHLIEDEGFFNDDNGYFYPASRAATLAKNVGKRQKIRQHRHREDQELTANFLDDTASSPVNNFSWNNYTLTNNQASMDSALDFSQGFSATHFEGTSAFQDHFGFSKSSLSANQLQNNQSCFQGKR